MASVVAASVAVGYALMPSRYIAVNAVGGAVTGIGGLFARKRLVKERRAAAIATLAALLSLGLPKVTAEALAAIQKELDVPTKEFEQQRADLYLTYLNAILDKPDVQAVELSELLGLQEVLRLSAAKVGTQFHLAARRFFSRHRAYIEDDEDSDSKLMFRKLVFLAERVLRKDGSEEGYLYESKRLQRIFSLSVTAWEDMAEATAVPIYQGALNRAVIESSPVTSAQLDQVRDSLGISAGRAEGMHGDIYVECAEKMLDPSLGKEAKLSKENLERLAQVETLLALPADVASRLLVTLVSPLYKQTTTDIIAEVEGLDSSLDEQGATKYAGRLALRKSELGVTAEQAGTLEVEVIRLRAQKGFIEEAVRYLRVQNVQQALATLKNLVSYSGKMTAFLALVSNLDASTAYKQAFGGVVDGMARPAEATSLYRLMVLECLQNSKLSESQDEMLDQLRIMLGLSEADSAGVYEAAARPLLRKAVEEATSADLSDAQRAQLQQSVIDLGLPEAVFTSIAIEIYSKKLREVAGEQKIMNEEEAASLSKLRDFLGLEMEQLYDIHAEVCSGSYLNSVSEVMGVTGTIPDEYWDGLNRLSDRLGLSEATTEKLFAEAALTTMQELGARAIDILEQKLKSEQAKAQGRDAGTGDGALGIAVGGSNSLGTEVLNLVDFCVSSKVLTSENQGDVISVSLRGEFEDRVLKELYRQYLIEAFSGTRSAQNERLFSNLSRLALVLGLNDKEVASIHNELGSIIYRNYLGRTLQEGDIGEKDMQFLGSIKQALNMDSKKCEELVMEAKVNHVNGMFEGMLRGDFKAEDVRQMRDKADQYEIDLLDDLHFSEQRRASLFVCELEDLINSGELTPEDTGALEELCEPFRFSETQASEILTQTVKKQAFAGFVEASAALGMEDHATAVDKVKGILKFAQLVPTPVELPKSLSVEDRQELLMLFQANALTDGAVEEAKKGQIELLKRIMSLEGASEAA